MANKRKKRARKAFKNRRALLKVGKQLRKIIRERYKSCRKITGEDMQFRIK